MSKTFYTYFQLLTRAIKTIKIRSSISGWKGGKVALAEIDPSNWHDEIKLGEDESLMFGVGGWPMKNRDNPDICPLDGLPVDPSKGWFLHIKSCLPNKSRGLVVIDFEPVYHLAHFQNDIDGGPWDVVE